MSVLLLSVMGAFAEFERSLIKEHQLEDIMAKKRGVYKGRNPKLTLEKQAEIKQRIANGESNSHLANDLSISRGTLYQYLKN